MLPVGQKRQNESLDQDVDSDDSSEQKPAKRNGRRKIKIEYIEDKNRRHITFSKRKAGIMKKAYELSTLTGTQVLLLVVSETGLVYTFTTTKLQPIVTKPEGKNLIQACLNTPDPSMPDMNTAAESKLDEGYMPRPSNDSASVNNASPVPVVNRIPEDTPQSQLSPQTASSHSPMMQPAPNVMRQQHQPIVVPPMAATANVNAAINNSSQQQSSGSVNNYSQSNQPQSQQQPHHHQQHHNSQASPQMGMPPYNQQRYPPPQHQGYSGNLPQPNQSYPPSQHNQAQHQPQYGGPQQPYYQQSPQQTQHPSQQQQNNPNGPPPLGYWSFNDQQQVGGGNAPQQHQQQQPQVRQNIKAERP